MGTIKYANVGTIKEVCKCGSEFCELMLFLEKLFMEINLQLDKMLSDDNKSEFLIQKMWSSWNQAPRAVLWIIGGATISMHAIC